MLRHPDAVEHEADDLPDLPGVRRTTGSKVFCKSCNRKDFHYLAIDPPLWGFCVKLMTLGFVGLFGPYRCVCCDKKRIGRFDLFRGRPRGDTTEYARRSFDTRGNGRESWSGDIRRARLRKFLRRLVPRFRSRTRKFRGRRHW